MGDILFGIIVILAYFFPSLVAAVRDHRNGAAISVLNLFLGWTFIGWVVALVWSLTTPPPEAK